MGRPGKSTSPKGVDEADRLARVKLSCTIEPGDIRVTGLVSEVGVSNVLGYLEAAADIDTHWAYTIGQQHAAVNRARAPRELQPSPCCAA